MDPTAALATLRRILGDAKKLVDEMPDGGVDELDASVDLAGIVTLSTDLLDEFVNTFDGLDEWITRGGFLPLAWQPGRNG